jgi:hypothetical protein
MAKRLACFAAACRPEKSMGGCGMFAAPPLFDFMLSHLLSIQ